MHLDDVRQQLALGRAVLAAEGCFSNVGGQVTVRDGEGRGFWATGFDYFDDTEPEAVALLGWNLEVLQGRFALAPAMRTHLAIYQRRADVNAVVHLHSHHVTVLASTRQPLGMYSVTSVLFHDNQVLYADDGHKPHPSVAEELGSNRVALMANHGALIASESLERAIVEAVTLEECARTHLDCRAAGALEITPDEVAAGVRSFAPHYLQHRWAAAVAAVRRAQPERFAIS
jgi:L-fuculose-phosphate aldolase